MQYTNKPIDFAAQLATLKGYGLQVRDEKSARVWNRRFSVKPQMPKKLPGKWIGNAAMVKPHKLYAQLCTLAYMEQTVAVNCGFVADLKALLARFPMVDVAAMGFPKDWEKEPLWAD